MSRRTLGPKPRASVHIYQKVSGVTFHSYAAIFAKDTDHARIRKGQHDDGDCRIFLLFKSHLKSPVSLTLLNTSSGLVLESAPRSHVFTPSVLR